MIGIKTGAVDLVIGADIGEIPDKLCTALTHVAVGVVLAHAHLDLGLLTAGRAAKKIIHRHPFYIGSRRPGAANLWATPRSQQASAAF